MELSHALLILGLTLQWSVTVAQASSSSAPAFQTISGYDRVHGKDAICWLSKNTLLGSCTPGNSIRAVQVAPIEGNRLRTGTWYNFAAEITLNVSNHFPNVSASVIACRVGTSGGLCSPFVVPEDVDTLSENPAPPVLQSERVVQELLPQEGPLYSFGLDIPMRVNSEGDFVVIVALDLDSFYMANSLQPVALVSYQVPAEILTVSSGARYAGYAAIAAGATILLWLLAQTIRNRKQASLRMTQGTFLIVWLLAGLSTVICAVLLEPRNDAYCRVGLPMVITSLQLFYAITVGRVWRINSVISPALLKVMDWEENSWIQKLFFDSLRKYTACLLRWENSTRPKRLHKIFTEKQLVMVVLLLTLPQVMLQVVAAIVQPWQLALDMNEEESIGRQYCALPEDLPYANSIFFYGIYLFLLLIVMLFLMAWTAQGLPSFFNESKIIFSSLLSSIFLLILGLAVILGTRSPTTSPSIPYLVSLVIVLFVILQSSIRLLLPKLKMAWRSEIIILADVMSAHSQNVREKQARRSPHHDSPFHTSGADSNSHVHISGLDSNYNNHNNNNGGSNQRNTVTTSSVSQEELLEKERAVTNVMENSMEELIEETLKSSAMASSGSARSAVRSPLHSPLPTQEDRHPFHVVTMALELQNHLSQVQKQIVSGLQVKSEDWKKVRELASEMEKLLADYDKDDRYIDAFETSLTAVDATAVGTLGEVLTGETADSSESDLAKQAGPKFLHQQPGNGLLDPEIAATMLGDGPMRFATPRRSVHNQLSSLSKEDQLSYRLLRSDWQEEEMKNGKRSQQNAPRMSGEMTLRFLRHCTEHDATKKELATWRAMKKYHARYLSLKANALEEQLLTKTLFPIPGVRTLDGGNSIFYMRPCRYHPSETATSLIIDNLVYCMQTMLEDESACTHGIGFLACMDDWQMKHFSTDYCFQFMQALEGHATPVRVTHFLIVNPPAWFGTIWAIMKGMLSEEFQKKVHMIPECQLSNFLAPGYHEHLPDDMATGEAPTDALVRDWVTFRNFIEGEEDEDDEFATPSRWATTATVPSSVRVRPFGRAENTELAAKRKSLFKKISARKF